MPPRIGKHVIRRIIRLVFWVCRGDGMICLMESHVAVLASCASCCDDLARCRVFARDRSSRYRLRFRPAPYLMSSLRFCRAFVFALRVVRALRLGFMCGSVLRARLEAWRFLSERNRRLDSLNRQFPPARTSYKWPRRPTTASEQLPSARALWRPVFRRAFDLIACLVLRALISW